MKVVGVRMLICDNVNVTMCSLMQTTDTPPFAMIDTSLARFPQLPFTRFRTIFVCDSSDIFVHRTPKHRRLSSLPMA